jgi:heterotetrameric sarcosine oxidase gamma subunit
MADPPRAHPLAAIAAQTPASDTVRLAALPPTARLSLRAAPTPDTGTTINRATTAGDHTALMLGPDEFLLIGGEIPASLPANVVDVSHRSTGIEVSGPFAVDALNAFVALDLAEAAFPVGMCTRTLLGKAEVVIWRTGPECFRLEVARSFAPYVWVCLEEARREFL